MNLVCTRRLCFVFIIIVCSLCGREYGVKLRNLCSSFIKNNRNYGKLSCLQLAFRASREMVNHHQDKSLIAALWSLLHVKYSIPFSSRVACSQITIVCSPGLETYFSMSSEPFTTNMCVLMICWLIFSRKWSVDNIGFSLIAGKISQYDFWRSSAASSVKTYDYRAS